MLKGQTYINYFIMDKEISKRTIVRIFFLVSIVYFTVQIFICCLNDREFSMNFWLEHNNVQKLIDAGLPDKSGYTSLVGFISDYHFWLLRAGVVCTLFLALFYKNKNRERYRLLLKIVISTVIILLLCSVLVTWILKIFTGKPRPYTLLDMYSHFSFSTKFHSFPSGHTTETFSYLIPYIYFIKKNYVKIILILYGFLVSFTRVILARHYITDVIFGIYVTIIIGIFICYIIDHSEKTKKNLGKGLD